MAIISRRFMLGRSKMLEFLAGLEANSDSTARSLYLPSGLSPGEIGRSLEEMLGQPNIPAELPEIVAGSKNGAGILFCSPATYLVLPPFPIEERGVFTGCVVAPLRSILMSDLKIAIILVRLGAYAVGLCQGESLRNSKVGTGLVHGRHRQGGSSQARFRRHREKQIEYFLTRVCGHIQEQLGDEIGTLDYMVYGGAWTTILSLQKRCPLLQRFDGPLLPPLLDIHEPRKAVLEATISRVWSSTVVEWHSD